MNPVLKLALITAACTFGALFILFCFLMGGLWAMLGLSLALNACLTWLNIDSLLPRPQWMPPSQSQEKV